VADVRARAVDAVLALWRTSGEDDPSWPDHAGRIVDVVIAALPPVLAPGESPLIDLLAALKVAPGNLERVRMAQVVIDRVAEVRDLSIKAVWATRPDGATASGLARHTGVPVGIVNVVIHGRDRR
jgi:hypothetical protein